MSDPISAATAAASLPLSRSSTPSNNAVSEKPEKARVAPSTLEQFWLRMAAMFGHSWISQYGAAPEGIGGDTWSAVLADLSPQQIAAGMHATSRLGSDWPPSAPRFRSLCLGIPSLAQARIETRPGYTEPSAFCRLLWEYLDVYAFTRADDAKADRMLREAYELAREFVMAGGALPVVTGELELKPAEPVRVAAPDTARRYLAEIENHLGKGKPEPEPFTGLSPEAKALQAQLERRTPDYRELAAGEGSEA